MTPAPVEQFCDVWVADVALWPAHDSLLDETERCRADAFVRPAARQRFVLGASLVKLAVADRTGLAPAAVHVVRRCDTCGRPHGRPHVPGCDIHVSVSHSGSVVAVAVTRHGPVGVDVEDRTARRRMPPAEHILAPSEPIRRAEDLLTYWCRKESVVKATGEGLQVPLREVVVSPAAEPSRLVSYRGGAVAAAMADLGVGEDHAAALTVLTRSRVDVAIRPAAALLMASR